MKTKTLSSGRELVVAIAPYAASNKLKKTLFAELLRVDINIDVDIGKLLAMDLSNVSGTALNTLKNLVCTLLASDAVEAAVFECAGRCTLDTLKITRETFEPEAARGDFIPVAWEVIVANVGPFFAGIDFASLTAASPPTASPTSR